MRRILVLGCALALCFLGASALPAYAEETPPPVRSSPGDPFGGQSIPPGPVFVITPGSPGSTLGPSADPEDVKAQIERDKQQQSTAGPSGTPTSSVSPSATPGAGQDGTVDPVAGPSEDASSEDDSSAALWWSVGVGALAVAALLAVLLAARRKRDRDGSDSLNDHAP